MTLPGSREAPPAGGAVVGPGAAVPVQQVVPTSTSSWARCGSGATHEGQSAPQRERDRRAVRRRPDLGAVADPTWPFWYSISRCWRHHTPIHAAKNCNGALGFGSTPVPLRSPTPSVKLLPHGEQVQAITWESLDRVLAQDGQRQRRRPCVPPQRPVQKLHASPRLGHSHNTGSRNADTVRSMPPTPSPSPDPKQPAPTDPRRSWRMLIPLLVISAAMWFWRSSTEDSKQPAVDYSVFFGWVEKAKVELVTLEGERLTGKLKAPETVHDRQIDSFHTYLPSSDEALLPLLRAKGVRIAVTSKREPFAVQLILSLLPWALIVGVWVWMSRRAQSMMAGGGPLGSLKSHARKFDKNTAVDVTFDDIAGLKSAKQDLQEIVQFLKEPARFRRLGGKAPRGVLLVGPPGTGKTLLARAVAGESGVPFYSISASEFIEMFVGLGAARVRELFQEAKKSAPAIVFIDEIDAIGRARGAGLGAGHDEREQTLNQLLWEMDGFNRNDLLVVLAATNRPDVLDPALLRPGRFDRRVVVDRPERPARKAILGVHTKGKPLAADVNLDALAESTPGFSGADLANLVNEAALHATRKARDAITTADFSEAYDKIVLGDPRETKLGSREKRRVAVHEAGHAVCARFSPDAEPLRRVTILPRGLTLGATQQTPGQDRHLATQPELTSQLRVLMGGYSAERLVLGDISSGAENDLREATDLAAKMVAHYGMSEKLGPVYYDYRTEHPFLGQKIATDGGTSQTTVAAIEDEARSLLSGAMEEATQLLTRRRTELDRLFAALLERETLEREDLDTLLGPTTMQGGESRESSAPAIAVATGLPSTCPLRS